MLRISVDMAEPSVRDAVAALVSAAACLGEDVSCRTIMATP
jgi:hypothetical protein